MTVVTVLEIILVFVGIPLVLYLGIAALTLRPSKSRAPRYQPGQEWPYPPVWWSAHPGALSTNNYSFDNAVMDSAAAGGARGNW